MRLLKTLPILAVVSLSLSLPLWSNGFGSDRRRAAPWESPYSSVGLVICDGFIGSGILVDRDLFLTCAHCVVDESGAAMRKSFTVRFGYAGHRVVYSAGVKAFWPQPLDRDPGSGEDWALVRLDRPVGDYCGWVACQNLSEPQMLGKNVVFSGYGINPQETVPEFSALQRPFTSPGSVREVNPRIFHTDVAGWGGSSGGAILSLEHSPPTVLGVFSAVVDFGVPTTGGFLKEYQLQGGNVGVPARGWIPLLDRLPPSRQNHLKRCTISNRQSNPVVLRLRYFSIWEQQDVVTPLITIPGHGVQLVLDHEDGWNRQDLWLQTQSLEPDGQVDEARWPHPVEHLDSVDARDCFVTVP